MNRRTSRRTSGERQEVEREIRQQGRKFINLKNLIYIKKQNKTIITKKKTKGKEKKERERERERKEKQILPDIELGTFCTPDRIVITTPRETHRDNIDNISLKAFSSGSVPLIKLIEPC